MITIRTKGQKKEPEGPWSVIVFSRVQTSGVLVVSHLEDEKHRVTGAAHDRAKADEQGD